MLGEIFEAWYYELKENSFKSLKISIVDSVGLFGTAMRPSSAGCRLIMVAGTPLLWLVSGQLAA